MTQEEVASITSDMSSIYSDDDTQEEEKKSEEKAKKKALKDSVLWQKFVDDIYRYKRNTDYWHKLADDISEKYSNDSKNSPNGKDRVPYNILWSSVQLKIPVLYARTPKVAVTRRHLDRDPVGRLAARIAQRAGQVSVDLEKDHFDCVMYETILDRLLPGRGVAWARYESTIESGEDERGEPLERVTFEKATEDYIYLKDFGHSEARTWADVKAVWKRAYMFRSQVEDRFGREIAVKLSYTDTPEDIGRDKAKADLKSAFGKAIVYERWDKETGKVYWFSEDLKDEFIEISDPPCHFTNFFPVPRPLYATLNNRTLIPTPDYKLYKQLADDLNTVTRRKSALIKLVRLVGVHDATISELAVRFENASDGQLIPVKQWSQWAEKGGFKGVIQWFPIEEVAQTINILTQTQADLQQRIYEITGDSDIVRGNTSPYETQGAQQLKAQFANVRTAHHQAEVQRFAADLIRLKVEIILEHFSDELIQQMIGFQSMDQEDQQLFPQAMELLRSDKMMSFKIDIETDSTLAMDEQADKESANEYIQTIGTLMQQGFQAVQMRPELMTFMIELIKFGARRYRAGQALESVLENTLDQIVKNDQAAAQNPQPEQPDPALIKAQTQAQAAQMKIQSDSQIAQQRLGLDSQIAQQQLALDQYKVQSDANLKNQKMQINAQMKAQQMQQKAQTDMQAAAMKAATPEAQMAANTQTPIILNINPGMGGMMPPL